MLEQFKKYIKTKLNINKTHRILLAVSGGADSVAMLDIFAKLGFDCGVAHCNFHLREDDSDEDERLVEELAKQYRFPFYKTDFETEEYATDKGISIEMAARDLR